MTLRPMARPIVTNKHAIEISQSFAAVRKTPSWPRSWANFSLSSLYSHRNAWADLHRLGQPNTFLACRGRPHAPRRAGDKLDAGQPGAASTSTKSSTAASCAASVRAGLQSRQPKVRSHGGGESGRRWRLDCAGSWQGGPAEAHAERAVRGWLGAAAGAGLPRRVPSRPSPDMGARGDDRRAAPADAGQDNVHGCQKLRRPTGCHVDVRRSQRERSLQLQLDSKVTVHPWRQQQCHAAAMPRGRISGDRSCCCCICGGGRRLCLLLLWPTLRGRLPFLQWRCHEWHCTPLSLIG